MPDATDPRPEPKGCQLTLTSLLVFTLVAGILVLLLIPVLYHAGNTSSRNICALNLSQMYKAMYIYKSAFGNNKDYMPHTGDAFFTCLLGHSSVEHPGSYSAKAPLFGIPELFVCDRSGSDETSVTPGGKMADYKGPPRHPLVPSGNPSALVDGIFAGWPIACDKPENHKGAGGNVLRFDGSVGFIQDAEYQAAVKACSD